ncbi:hypothetical protein V6N13_130005 [Hibiscus sabdariffa]|uniref:DUF659 domain-containing protein n=1 Tax=Hibiscus sabdariffa TaxID=183260 RepID=A0ABR2SMX5_9ROSI
MVFGKRKSDQISNEPENLILSDNLEETNDMLLEEEKMKNEQMSMNCIKLMLQDQNKGSKIGKVLGLCLMREAVDLKIMRCLCANAIAFNCLRSPQWHEMVQAINQTPKGYKSPSFEKARTSLLDECYRSIEKELSPVKDTWYVHGVSVVSDGWSNCKQDQLINVIATNSRGAMFMYCGVFIDYAKNCIAAGREIQKDVSTKTLGSLVVEIIHDDKFWGEVKEIVRITKPIYMLLKFCNGEGPRLGEIYERVDNMLGEIKNIMATNKYKHEFSSMEQIVVTRWDKMTIPLHCLGFALTPRFYDNIYLETLAPGDFTRRAPNFDKEAVMGCMEAFGKISENTYEEMQLRDQFAEFQLKKEIYSMPQAQMDVVTSVT